MVQNNNKKQKFVCVLIFFILALFLRIAFFHVIGINKKIDYFNQENLNQARRSLIDGGGLIRDELDYQEIAVSIANGDGFSRSGGKPTAFRAPGFPTFLAIIFIVFGYSIYVGVLANIMISALTVIPLFYLASKLFSIRIASIACLIYSFYPLSIFWSNGIYTEPLFVFLLITSFWLFVINVSEKIKGFYQILFFIFLSFASLIKPYILVFFVLYILCYLIKKRLNFWEITGIVMYIIIFSLWPIRNYYTLGKFSLGSNSGLNFWVGSAGKIKHGLTFISGGTYNYEKELLKDVDNPEDEFSVQNMFMHKAFETIKDHPFEYLKVVFFKILWMWKFWPLKSSILKFLVYSGGFLIIYVPAIIVFLNKRYRVGIFESKKIKSAFYFLLGLILVFTIVSAVYWPLGRFRYPIDIVILPFTAYGINVILDLFKLKFF